MEDFEQSLRDLTLAPYIVKAMALIGVSGRGGSNMFRHQLSTMAILLDYKIVDPVLLKAAVIHDLFEDAPDMPGVTEREITALDADGPGGLRPRDGSHDSHRRGQPRAKGEYLSRIMLAGSRRARSSSWPTESAISPRSVSSTTRRSSRYLDETTVCILPHAEQVNPDMFRELSDLVQSRSRGMATD